MGDGATERSGNRRGDMTSRHRVLSALKAHGPRPLPDGAHSADNPRIAALGLLRTPVVWNWSWEISQRSLTVDYRKRISELGAGGGYEIVSFSVPWSENGKAIVRHGYVLISEPAEEPVQASLFRRAG